MSRVLLFSIPRSQISYVFTVVNVFEVTKVKRVGHPEAGEAR
jgi:hypothetical protein